MRCHCEMPKLNLVKVSKFHLSSFLGSRLELKVMTGETASKLYILIYICIYLIWRQAKVNSEFKLQIVCFSLCFAMSHDEEPGRKIKGRWVTGDGRWDTDRLTTSR